MTLSFGADQLAVRGTLQAAFAESQKDKLLGALDITIRDISHLGIASGRTSEGHESSSKFAARICHDASIQALMERCFFMSSNLPAGLDQFKSALIESFSKSLNSHYGDESAKKAQKVSEELIKLLSQNGSVEKTWVRAKASSDALAYQSGPTLHKYTDMRTAFCLVAGIKDPAASQADHIKEIMATQRGEIKEINAQRCLRRSEKARDQVEELTAQILLRVNDRTDRSSSKTSEKIAQEIRSTYVGNTDSIVAMRHPLAQIMANLSIGCGGLLGVAEVREAVVKDLARSLYTNKHYVTDGEALRKAEHLFSSLCEGLDYESVGRYVMAYLSALDIDADALAAAKMGARIKDFGSPVLEVTGEDISRHKSFLFGERAAGLAGKRSELVAKCRLAVNELDMDRKEVSHDKMVKALFADPGVALAMYEVAVFDQLEERSDTQSKENINEQLRALSSDLLALYRDQKQSYDSASAVARAFKSKEHGVDPATRYATWLLNATNQFMDALQERSIQTSALRVNNCRDALGTVTSIEGRALSPPQELSYIAKVQHEASNAYATLEAEIVDGVVSHCASTDNPERLLESSSRQKLLNFYKAYYSRLDVPTGVEDWSIQLSMAFTQALGKASPSKYETTPEARERSRILAERLIKEISALCAGEPPLEQLRNQALDFRPLSKLDPNLIEARVKRLEAYDYFSARSDFDFKKYECTPEQLASLQEELKAKLKGNGISRS